MRPIAWFTAALVLTALLGVGSVATATDPPGSLDACGAKPEPPLLPAPHEPVGAVTPAQPPRAEPAVAHFIRASQRASSQVSEEPEVAAIRSARDPECGEISWEIEFTDGSRLGVPLKPVRVETEANEVIVHFR